MHRHGITVVEARRSVKLDQGQKQSFQIVHERLVEEGDFPLIHYRSISPTDVLIHRASLNEVKGVTIEPSHHPASFSSLHPRFSMPTIQI
jgi:hypothetical protein